MQEDSHKLPCLLKYPKVPTAISHKSLFWMKCIIHDTRENFAFNNFSKLSVALMCVSRLFSKMKFLKWERKRRKSADWRTDFLWVTHCENFCTMEKVENYEIPFLWISRVWMDWNTLIGKFQWTLSGLLAFHHKSTKTSGNLAGKSLNWRIEFQAGSKAFSKGKNAKFVPKFLLLWCPLSLNQKTSRNQRGTDGNFKRKVSKARLTAS